MMGAMHPLVKPLAKCRQDISAEGAREAHPLKVRDMEGKEQLAKYRWGDRRGRSDMSSTGGEEATGRDAWAVAETAGGMCAGTLEDESPLKHEPPLAFLLVGNIPRRPARLRIASGG